MKDSSTTTVKVVAKFVKVAYTTKMKCNIKGCENEAEQIKKQGMWGGALCRKHFDEIYTGIIYEEGPDTEELVKSKYYRRATFAEKQAKNKS